MKDQTIRAYVVDKQLAVSGRTSSGSRRCSFNGCNFTTREGKDFCPDHVGEHPYVKGVMAVLNSMDAEMRGIDRRGWRAVDVKGQRCAEILLALELHGARTVERLLREVFASSCPQSIVSAYVEALHRAGKVIVGSTSRGSTVVRLVGDKAQCA